MSFWGGQFSDHKFIYSTPQQTWQVYAWGDNDHGQQGNGTTIVNRRPALVCGLEGIKVARVACGSSHSVAWTAPDPPLPAATEPVMFTTTKDPLGAYALGQFYFGNFIDVFLYFGWLQEL